jgi:hypothetical protein
LLILHSRREHFFFSQRDAVDKGLHRSFPVAPSALIRSFFIVQLNPRAQMALKFFECFVDLFTKRDSVELIEHRLVKALTDPSGLGTLGLGPGVAPSPDRSALSIRQSHALPSTAGHQDKFLRHESTERTMSLFSR